MKSRKVGFKFTQDNVSEFVQGFTAECSRHNFADGLNIAVDLGQESKKIFELRFCKDYYDHTRSALASSAAFCQGMAACYYMVKSNEQQKN